MARVVDELFGKDTGDPIAKLSAENWTQATNLLHDARNLFGGATPYRHDWYLPQPFREEKLREWSAAMMKAGKDPRTEFIAKVEPMLNPRRTFSNVGVPIGAVGPDAAERLRNLIGHVYDTHMGKEVYTGDPEYVSALSNRRIDSRVLQFRDGESWRGFQKAFGDSDTAAIMASHIDRMSNEIGQMQVLGPYPEDGAKFLLERAQAGGADSKDLRRIQNEWKLESMALNRAVMNHEDLRVYPDTPWGTFERIYKRANWAGVFRTSRQFVTATALGRAVFTTTQDLVTMTHTALFDGLPLMRMFREGVGQLTSRERREFAVLAGLGGEDLIRRTGSLYRAFSEELHRGSGKMGQLAEFTVRSTGLEAVTDANRKAVGMAQAYMVAKMAGHTWDELPTRFRNGLQRFAVDAHDWDIIRAAPSGEVDGVKFAMIDNIASDRELDVPYEQRLQASQKLSAYMRTEMGYGVIQGDVRSRSGMLQGTQANTLLGEAVRTVGLFRSFTTAYLQQHMLRAVYATAENRALAYTLLPGLMLGMTAMGGLTVQLKDLAKGKAPPPMNNSEFWASAMMQGGGLGIFGDFLFSDVNRYGGSLQETLVGPVAGLYNDARKLTLGNLVDLLSGKDTKFLGDLVHFASRHTPGTNLSYNGVVFQRLFFDQLQMAADPGAYRRMQEQERLLAKQYYGQRFWWRPGQTLPEALR